MFVFTKKGVLSPLQSISLLAIFFTSMGVATVSPAMAKLAAQFPSNNYALISTLPTLFIVPTTLWAGAVAGKKIRYRTISLVGILLFLIGGIAPFFLTESFTVLLICRAVFGIGVGLRASLGNALVMQYYTGKEQADMLGYGNLISNFGGVLLQMVAGSLAEYGWNYTFLAHLLGLFSLLLLVFQPEPEESCCAPTVTAEVSNGYRHSLLKSAGFDHRGRIATALTAFLLFLQQLVSYPILMNISLLFEHRHAGGATVAATALSLYSASGCLIGFFFGKIFYKLKRLTLVFGYLIAAAGAGILGFAKQTEILMIGSAIMGMTSVLLITSAYAILGMYISPNQSSLAIAIATGVSNLGGFASAYYLNMLGIITGEKLFTPIYVLMGVYTLLATAFMVYDPLRKNS